MKRFFTFLMAVWALLSISQTVKAADDVYLLSAESINGSAGSYNVNEDASKIHPMELVSGDTYKIKIESNSADVFYFRVSVSGSNQYQLYPSVNGELLSITEEGASISDNIAKTSGSGAWKVSFDKNTYEYITIHVVIKGEPKVWVDGKKKDSGTVTPPTPLTNPIANRKYSEGYYLVGNFFNFDGDAINYKDAVFKFEQQKKDGEGNHVYMVQIPATLTAKAQVMSVDATGTSTAVYGPGKNSQTIDNTNPKMGEDHTATLVFNNLVKGEDISENEGNYWNMKSRRTETTEGGQDGSYTIYLTISQQDKKPSSLTIKYDDMKRVAYYLSTDEKAIAMTLTSTRKNYDVRSDQGNFWSGKYLGTLYAQEGSEFYAISNAMNEDIKENIFAEYKDQVVYMSNILCTYPKLFLWGNGGQPLKNTDNKINAKNGTFKLNDDVVGVSSWEFNSNSGNNDHNKFWGNTGGEVKPQYTHKTITSLSMVGPAIPGTTTANGEWDWASPAANMDFDVSENCYKTTIATTDDNTNKVFRFVGNHTKEINWFENGTNPEDKAAKYPYGKTPIGHKASRSDPNEVSYTQNGLTENTDDNVNIIWNRPAGTWTVRFYVNTSTVEGNASYRYFYTISKNSELELRDFKDVVYKSETRKILKRGKYQYFRTWSDDTAWKRPENVDVFVVSKTPADKTSKGGFELTKINNFNTSEDVIPAKTGVILALKENLKVPGAVFYKRKSLTTYNTLVIPLEEATHKDLSYTGDNRLEKCIVATNIPTADEKNVNYLFGFYHAIHGLGLDNATDKQGYNQNDYLLGFWISNGKGLTYANSSYLPIEKAIAEKLNLGTSNDFSALQNQSVSAKKIPALFFDFGAVDNDVTGIQGVVESKTVLDGKYYTLSGQQVEHPTVGGIYIHNGKKYVIK